MPNVFITDYTLAEVLDIEESILGPAGLSIVLAQCKTEEEADERLASLVMADGYLPGDLTLTEYTPKEDDDAR